MANWGWLVALVLAGGAVLLLWPRDAEEPTHWRFEWDEPGLHDHLAAAALPPGVNRTVILAQPDATLDDPALRTRYGGHSLESIVWRRDLPAGRLELRADHGGFGQGGLAAQYPLGWDDAAARAEMELFLEAVLVDPGGADEAAAQWSSQSLPLYGTEKPCRPGETPGADGCGTRPIIGKQYATVLPDPRVRWKAWYQERGGIATAQPVVEQQAYGPLGRLLTWGEWGMGIAVETLVLDGPDSYPWRLRVDREDHVSLSLLQTEPVPDSRVEGRLREHLAGLGFHAPRFEGLLKR